MNTHFKKIVLRLVLGALLLSAQNTFASLGGWLFETNRNMEAWIAGLEQKVIEVDGDKWLYYIKQNSNGVSSGDACTVLLHGFSAEASHWFRFARHLKNTECIIIPDLPGFGRSSYDEQADYSIEAQTLRLNRFLESLQVSDQYHLAGSSMGGQIVAMYSLRFPKQLASLVLFDAGGVLSPMQSDMTKSFESTSKSIFELENYQEFSTMYEMTMSDPPWAPSIVKNFLGEGFVARADRLRSIFSQIYFKGLIEDELVLIKAPTLIVWGEEDRLLHPSMSEVFHKGINGSELVTMPGVGHLPFLEQPSNAAEYYLNFVNGLARN